MTAVKPVYPNGVFAWTDRVNAQDIDFANDPNSLASEIISIETTLGTRPQVESNLPVGNPKTYNNVSARISDAMSNQQMPVAELRSVSTVVPNNTFGSLNTYKAVYDPFGMFNTAGLSIPANGWWLVSASQTWAGWMDGYSYMTLNLNGSSNIVDAVLFNWEFPGNAIIEGIPGRFIDVPAAGGRPIPPSGPRPITTTVTFQGLCQSGDKFSVFSENGTSNASHLVKNLVLKAAMIRSVSGSFATG